ncbi:NUDIX domain-containing protein [Streptomyces bikiniensis]|uniref:NUDIX domain-containing protein n=1 Tax=Streptomyces bikiniensis TaxID=1896 RepID=A0ABW8CYA6_STRBI
MTTPSAPDGSPGPSMTDEEYGALRASAALWAGTSVLITDEYGRVLVQRVDYRPSYLLPGGAVDKGESPARAAARELWEELGVTAVVDRGLAVDWVSAEGFGAPGVMRFPGEILHVYDGGVWDEGRIAAIRLPGHEVEAVGFAEPADLPGLMTPGDARRVLSALRARIDGAGPAFLEDGVPIAPGVLDRAGVLRTARVREHFPFRPAPVPEGLPVRRSEGWLLAPDGRVLVLLDPGTGAARLPGGAPGPVDHGDPWATLVREAGGEAAATAARPLYLGHLLDPEGPDGSDGPDRSEAAEAAEGSYALVCHAAVLTRLGPPSAGADADRAPVRVLATPEQALELFDRGPHGAAQLAAVHRARALLGIPRADRRAVTELPGPVTFQASGDVRRPCPKVCG